MSKMNRVEVKHKLKGIIRDMLLSDYETEEVPDAVANQILYNYGCTVGQKSSETDNLDVFLKNLQKWIENSHLLLDESKLKISEENDFGLDLYEKYLEAEREYCKVTSELVNILEEVVKHKGTYSEYFKNECKSEETSMEVLSKKCQFLKSQFFLKLYGEENALKGHLALREKLKKELDLLKKKYSELLEYNKCISEIKNDKTFCELFRVYKELRKIEQMTEIIGKICKNVSRNKNTVSKKSCKMQKLFLQIMQLRDLKEQLNKCKCLKGTVI